jgi:hypothetical protein
MHHFIKGANYKSTFNGLVSQWQLYRDSDKRLYNKYLTADSIFSRDVHVNHDTIYKSSLEKNDTTILGYTCDKLTFICNNGTQVYYFDSQFAIDPILYADCQEGNWYEFLKVSKSPAIKEIIRRGKIAYTLTATQIQRKQLDDDLFVLLPGIAIVEIPMAK